MQAYLTILSYISIHGVSAIPLIATVWSFNRLRTSDSSRFSHRCMEGVCHLQRTTLGDKAAVDRRFSQLRRRGKHQHGIVGPHHQCVSLTYTVSPRV